MLFTILLAVAVSLIMTGFLLFIIRRAWDAWDHSNEP
jgi:hypothetical protein